MPRVTFNRMSRKKNHVRRRRSSTLTKAKFKPRTTAANRSLIKSNAYAIRAVRNLMPPPVWTDYQYCRSYGPFFGSDPTDYTSILCDKLTQPTNWLPCLRRDTNALQSTTTLVKRMQINLRYDLGESNWVQMTTFVVSLRRDAANRDPFDTASLVLGDDYIYSTQQQQNVRLNPAVFKCHYVRNCSLCSATWRGEKTELASGVVVTSNSETTFAKGQVNMKLNFKLRQPTTPQNWKQMTIDQLSPHQRLYILTFFVGSTNEVDDISPSVTYDCLYTCYNSS